MAALAATGAFLWAGAPATAQPAAGSPAAGPPGLPSPVAAALAEAQLPASSVGIVVEPLGAGASIEVNGTTPFNPASTMKLVTAVAALELLGPAYTWKTPVEVTAPPRDGVLEGNLYIRGSGDPHFVFDDLRSLLTEVRQRGIRDIRGDIVIDRSLFAPAVEDPAQFDGQPYRAYNVLPDPFLLNFKATELTFAPDAGTRSVLVFATPALPGQELGPVRYLDGPCGDWKARLNPDFTNPAHLTFVGGFPGSCGERHLAVSVYSHSDYAAAAVAGLWTEAGGVLGGRVIDGTIPPGTTVFAVHESASLAEELRDVNKYSSNVMARELFLDLAVASGFRPATPLLARRAVEDILTTHDLELTGLALDNGAGLSRTERISARGMATLLKAAFAQPFMPEFMASLPIEGVDGTARHRLSSTASAGRAHLKTGSLADVRAIAGYVLAASGRRYVLVFLINDPRAQAGEAAQDALVDWIVNHG